VIRAAATVVFNEPVTNKIRTQHPSVEEGLTQQHIVNQSGQRASEPLVERHAEADLVSDKELGTKAVSHRVLRDALALAVQLFPACRISRVELGQAII